MAVKAIPAGFHAVTPYLIVNGAARAIEFYKKAFAATELPGRMSDPGGRIAHTEIKIGDSIVMLADENPQFGNKSPQTLGGSAVIIALYVEDVDAVANKAVAAGAKMLFPVNDQFYGDRSGRLQDPFGHIWIIGTHKEDVSPEEMAKRFEAMMKEKK